MGGEEMNVCSSANRKADQPTEVKSLTLKLEGKGKVKTTYILLNLNFHYSFWFDPKEQKLIVSVNGKDTEIDLNG
jgi:hypothetical protein